MNRRGPGKKKVTFHHAAVVAPQKIISSAQSCVSRALGELICLTCFMLSPQVQHCVHFRVEETHLKSVARQGGSEWRLRPGVLWADITPRVMLRPTESETCPGSPGWEHKQGPWRRAWCVSPSPLMSHSQTWSVHCFSSRPCSLCMVGVLEWQAAGVALTSAAERELPGGACTVPSFRAGAGERPRSPWCWGGLRAWLPE